jgi:hypothetical protein
MVGDDMTVWHILRALEDRASNRLTPYSSRLEVADHLGRLRGETDPLFDEAIEKGYVEEHQRYNENWRLSDQGKTALDAQLFG